jgi:hypothetical protein
MTRRLSGMLRAIGWLAFASQGVALLAVNLKRA